MISRAQILAAQGYRCADCRRPAERAILVSRRLPAFWFDEYIGRWRNGQGKRTYLTRDMLAHKTVQVSLTICTDRGLCQACAAKELEPVETWETADESASERIERVTRASRARWQYRAECAVP